MPRLATVTVRQFLINSGTPMRRGDHPIYMSDDWYLSDMPEFTRLIIDQDEITGLDRELQALLDKLVPHENDISIRWNAYDSELSQGEGIMDEAVDVSYKDMDTILSNCNRIEYKYHWFRLEILWDETGVIITYIGECPRQFIMYRT